MEYLSPRSNTLVEQQRAEFVKNFKAVIISDTVKKIIAGSIPINENNGKSELIDDNHIEEINNLITKSAKDLTDEAIKGKLIKTSFNDNEVPTNFLDAVAQSAEAYVENESMQRANWFKLQIQNGKIKDAEKDFNNFNTKLKLTFQKLNFSVEEFQQMHEEQLAIAKSYEEESIMDSIKETVTEEINEAETRQEKIIEIMQEVQDTKKEYEAELEEKTNEDDIETAAISDPETITPEENAEENKTAETEGSSTENTDVVQGTKKASDADKLAAKFRQSKEDTNLNENEEKTKNTPAETAGNSKEGVGSMATYQNTDNFPSKTNEIGTGNGGYSGPSVDDLGTGVLDADESNLVENENKEEGSEENQSAENLDGENIANPKPSEDKTGETVSQVPNTDADAQSNVSEGETTTNKDGETVEYTENAEKIDATIKVDPVLGAEAGEIKKNAEVEEVEKTLENLALKFLPVSLMKLEVNNLYAKEDMTKVLLKIGDNNRKRFLDKINLRIAKVEELISTESADTTTVKEKLQLFKNNLKSSVEDAQYIDHLFAKIGVDSNGICSRESLFALSVSKNLLNRSSRKKEKDKKFSRILDEKHYGKSIENIVDYMFALTSMKRNLDKSKNIQLSMEEIAQHEERINGAIYELNSDDKDRANALKNLLGIKNIDHYFVYDNLLLDFNNNLTRVSEDQEETPVNVISSATFINKVLDKLENKGFERTASIENMVVHIVKGDIDPFYISPSLFEKICLAYGKKQSMLSKEGLENDVENSKIKTKAKVLLTIRRSAEALNIANQEFIDSFDKLFNYEVA